MAVGIVPPISPIGTRHDLTAGILSAVVYPLCVFTPEVGVLTETFVAWDVNHLLPGRTVVVSDPPPRGETVTRRPSWTADMPGLQFDPVPGDPPPSPERRAALARFVRDHGVQVVLVEFLDFADRWFDTLTGLGVQVWPRGLGADLSARLSSSYRRFEHATGIIVPTQAAAARLSSIGLPPAKIHIVPNHVAVPTTPPEHRAAADVIRCISIGRLVPKKGHRYLLDAFRLAASADSRLRLDIVGDGPLRAALEQQVTESGLADQVRLLGSNTPSDMLTRLDHADVFAHHAVTADDGDVETQPLAILHAMAAALPCVLTRHEGIPEIIHDGVNGCLVDERDVEATAAALTALAADAALRRRVGLAAWTTARTGHSHEHVRHLLLDLLELSVGSGQR